MLSLRSFVCLAVALAATGQSAVASPALAKELTVRSDAAAANKDNNKCGRWGHGDCGHHNGGGGYGPKWGKDHDHRNGRHGHRNHRRQDDEEEEEDEATLLRRSDAAYRDIDDLLEELQELSHKSSCDKDSSNEIGKIVSKVKSKFEATKSIAFKRPSFFDNSARIVRRDANSLHKAELPANADASQILDGDLDNLKLATLAKAIKAAFESVEVIKDDKEKLSDATDLAKEVVDEIKDKSDIVRRDAHAAKAPEQTADAARLRIDSEYESIYKLVSRLEKLADRLKGKSSKDKERLRLIQKGLDKLKADLRERVEDGTSVLSNSAKITP